MWAGRCLLEPPGTWEQGLLRPLLVAGHPCCLLFVCRHRMVTRSLCLCALISMLYGTSHWRRAHPVITSLKSVCKQGLGGRESGRASFSPVQAASPSRAHGTALWPPGGGVPRPSTRSLPGTAAPHSTPALPLLLPGLGAWHVVVFVCFLLVLLISLSPSPLSLLERRF